MRGRPKSNNSRNNQYKIRLNDEEDQMLNKPKFSELPCIIVMIV